MSGSDRSEQPKAIVGLGIVAATFVCCLIVGVLCFSQGRETERRNDSPHQHAQGAKAGIEKACASTDPAHVFDCVQERVEASEEQAHSEQDLSAQQRAATSAMIAAVASILTLLISGIGIWGLIKTISQGQEGIGLAREANEHAVKTSTQELRAYLDFETVSLVRNKAKDTETMKSIGVRTIVRNFGSTPAENVSIISSYGLIHPDGHFENLGKSEKPGLGGNAPNDTVRFSDFYSVTNHVKDGIWDHTITVVATITVTYTDAFKQPRELRSMYCSDGTTRVLGILPNSRVNK